MVAAVRAALGGSVYHRVRGVGDLLPQTAVHILLHQRINHKTGKGVHSHHRLHQVQSLHSGRHCGWKTRRARSAMRYHQIY